MKRTSAVLLLSLALCAPIFAQARPETAAVPSKPMSDAPRSARMEAFDMVWRTIKEKHFDPTFGGVNWDKVREQYEPRAEAAKTDQELHDLLQQMLGELHQSHFNIIPPEALVEESADAAPTGETGAQVQMVEGKATIVRVAAGSPAEKAGLKPGFVLTRIAGKDVAETVATLTERLEKRKVAPETRSFYLGRVLNAALVGKADTTVTVEYLDERNAKQTATVGRREITGEFSPAFGNFPPQLMEFEAKRLANGVGYIRFNIFVLPLTDRIKAAIRSMADAPGLIFDLRGNPGGFGAMAGGIAGLLESKPTSLGKMALRTGYMNMAVFPQDNPYAGPVAVLIDRGSASTSEIFAGGLQDLGRATIVGERSLGAALPSQFLKLPTGALFQCAFADFKTPNGKLLEGVGVTPDVVVPLTRATLLAGRDAQLDAALAGIAKKSPGKK